MIATAARVPSAGLHPKGTAPMPKLYEALAEAFLAEGVDTQFVLMGAGNMHWSTAFAKLAGGHNFYAYNEDSTRSADALFYGTTSKEAVAPRTQRPGET